MDVIIVVHVTTYILNIHSPHTHTHILIQLLNSVNKMFQITPFWRETRRMGDHAQVCCFVLVK